MDGEGEGGAPRDPVGTGRRPVSRSVREGLHAVVAERRAHEQGDRRKRLLAVGAPLARDAHERRPGGGRDVFELVELELERARLHHA
jgi:hypothetical protein